MRTHVAVVWYFMRSSITSGLEFYVSLFYVSLEDESSRKLCLKEYTMHRISQAIIATNILPSVIIVLSRTSMNVWLRNKIHG